jgi:hypothetical protein
LTGTVNGSRFVVKDAIAVVGHDNTGSGALILLSATPNACADARDHIQHANAGNLFIMITDQDPAATLGGTYPTSYETPLPARSSSFDVNLTDAQCQYRDIPAPDGTGDGTVTVSSVKGTTLAGSFDIVLEDLEHITGTFHAEECPELATDVSGPNTCVP